MKSLVKTIAMLCIFVGLAWGQGKKATSAEQKACFDQAQSVTAGRTAGEGGKVIAAVDTTAPMNTLVTCYMDGRSKTE